MKYITILLALIALSTSSCKTTKERVIFKSGSWYEGQTGRTIKGMSESFNPLDSTYSMRTNSGWLMKIKSDQIKWDE